VDEPRLDEPQVAALYRLVRLMCDNAPDLIWAKDLENRYTFCNRAMCQILLNAVDTEEPIGKTDMFFANREREAHPDNPHWHTFGEICRDSDSVVVASRTPRRFEEHGRVRGEMLYLDVFKAPLFDERGELIGTIGCGRIVTQERQLAEQQRLTMQELHESSLRTSALLAALPDLVFTVSREGVFLDAHGSSGDFALPPEAFLNRPLEVVLPPESAAEARHYLTLAFTTGKVQSFEYRLHVAGVERFWEARIAPCTEATALIIVRDITAQRQAEEELRRSEERLRTLVEHAVIGIYRTTPDGRVLMANPAAVRMAGYASFEEFARTDLSDAGRHGFYDRRRFLEAIERDGEVVGFENTWVRPDGTQVYVRENARAVRDSNGRTVYYEGTIEDLTHRKQLEEQLRQAQKIEAVGRVAGEIAHDFNNVMQAVLSLAPLLRARRENPDRHEATVVELEEQIGRGAALTNQLLLFSRREFARLERIDLNQAVRAASRMLRRLLRDNVALDLDLGSDPLPVLIDRSQLDQVLLNLVINASDAMPAGGSITIRTGSGDSQEVWVEVDDRGCGIPDEILDRVFEPFFTTKAPRQGTGLGLAVAHTIVQERGGRFEVKSQVGSGSTFRAVLPRSDGPIATREPTAFFSPSVLGHGERVLVVEDEPGARAGLHDLLEILGFRVTACASAEEALALAPQPTFTLLLTDLLLPGIHGGELAERLRAQWPDLKVIVMSGYSQDDRVHRAVRESRIRFLQKPFSIADLSREISLVLSGEGGRRRGTFGCAPG